MRLAAKSRRDGNAVWLALGLAIALLLQTLGTAHATALGGKPVLLDAFGNPLCITSGEHGSAGDDTRHGTLTDCCALACTVAAQTNGAPPDVVALRLPDQRLIAALFNPTFQGIFPAPLRSPGNPRAPPSAM